ncbi:unnamed protein product [Schistocephalus solidus]|uniref:Claudin n=1 Tax=Schistocephalus solidus TaxID=70667 RepID=A0A183T979_SCHSO|nr:unnamed protein product [Schistocephalus solidus]
MEIGKETLTTPCSSLDDEATLWVTGAPTAANLVLLIGLALLVAGTWGILNISSFLHAIALAFDKEATGSELYQDTHLIQTIAYVCVALGLLIFLISFFGCCGVVTDSACLLITFNGPDQQGDGSRVAIIL